MGERYHQLIVAFKGFLLHKICIFNEMNPLTGWLHLSHQCLAAWSVSHLHFYSVFFLTGLNAGVPSRTGWQKIQNTHWMVVRVSVLWIIAAQSQRSDTNLIPVPILAVGHFGKYRSRSDRLCWGHVSYSLSSVSSQKKVKPHCCSWISTVRHHLTARLGHDKGVFAGNKPPEA